MYCYYFFNKINFYKTTFAFLVYVEYTLEKVCTFFNLLKRLINISLTVVKSCYEIIIESRVYYELTDYLELQDLPPVVYNNNANTSFLTLE